MATPAFPERADRFGVPSAGYEIVDSRLAVHGEVILWSVGGPAPGRGQIFTIADGEAVCDLTVVEVTRNRPGWTALCRKLDS